MVIALANGWKPRFLSETNGRGAWGEGDEGANAVASSGCAREGSVTPFRQSGKAAARLRTLYVNLETSHVIP
jgi:hypothetical protein